MKNLARFTEFPNGFAVGRSDGLQTRRREHQGLKVSAFQFACSGYFSHLGAGAIHCGCFGSDFHGLCRRTNFQPGVHYVLARLNVQAGKNISSKTRALQLQLIIAFSNAAEGIRSSRIGRSSGHCAAARGLQHNIRAGNYGSRRIGDCATEAAR